MPPSVRTNSGVREMCQTCSTEWPSQLTAWWRHLSRMSSYVVSTGNENGCKATTTNNHTRQQHKQPPKSRPFPDRIYDIEIYKCSKTKL